MAVRICGLISFCLIASTVHAADVSSRIDAVTVYPSGAMVTRVANVNLNAGANNVRLIGLVDSIEVEGMQVEVDNDGVRIGQIKLDEAQQREAFDAEVSAVEKEIESVTAKVYALDDSSSAAKLRLQFLEGIAQGYAKEAWFEGTRGTADVASWRAALDLLQNGSVEDNQLIRDNEAKKNEFAKDLSVLRRNLARLRGSSLALVGR